MDKDLENLLRQAREEILRLRRTNDILSAKVEVIELFSLVFQTQPAYPSTGMSIDVAWLIQRRLEAIKNLDEK